MYSEENSVVKQREKIQRDLENKKLAALKREVTNLQSYIIDLEKHGLDCVDFRLHQEFLNRVERSREKFL